MALNLNTSHPLYGNIVELFGIDPATGTLASVKTPRTFSPQTGASYPTTAGTYGKSAKTNPAGGGGTIGGIPFAPDVELPNQPMTMFVVVNNSSLSSGTSPFALVSSNLERSPTIGFTAGGQARVFGQYEPSTGAGATGTTVVTGTGTGAGRAHSFAVTNSDVDHKLYVDGVQEGPAGTRYDVRNAKYSCLGGMPGFNAVGAEIVWVVWFNRELTPAEIADLHSSVGANNVIGLLDGAPAGGTPTVDSVTVTPANPSVTGGATQQFTATVAGTGAFSTTVTWSVDGTGNGTINSSGLYTAPAAGVSARNVVVRATAANGTTSGTAAVTVPAATGAGSFVTEAMVNNTGQVLANTSIRWSWFPGGRIGAFAGITPVEGVATTNAQGQLTATGLATGAGLLVAAQWINGATDDVVFYQAGTVA